MKQIANKIWTIDNFLTPEECQNVLTLDLDYKEADVYNPHMSAMKKTVRDNDRAIIDDPELFKALWKRLSPHLTILHGWTPYGLAQGTSQLGNKLVQQGVRIYRYTEGQYFKWHLDGIIDISPVEQSKLTFMVYLNEDFEGGRTLFSDAIIEPKTGMALLFEHRQLHEGETLYSGEKHVLRSDVMFKKEK